MRLRMLAALAAALALPLTAAAAPAVQAAPGGPAKQSEEHPGREVDYLATERGLSRAEAARRIGWQTRAALGRDNIATKLGDTFAGVWIHPDSDRPQIAATRSPSETRGLIDEELRAAELTDDADVVQVSYSLLHLDDYLGTLVSRLPEVNEGGTHLVDVSVHESRNRLLVMVPPNATLTSKQERFVTQALESPMAVRVVQPTQGTAENCAQRGRLNCNPPLRGGQAILIDNRVNCTAGFNARDSLGTAYLLTAGHCMPFGTVGGTSMMLDGIEHYLGLVHNWEFSGAGDYGIVRVNDSGSTGWNIRAWVAVTNSADNGGVQGTGQNWEYPIKSTALSMDLMRVCVTGAASAATSCGQVSQRGLPLTYVSPATGVEARVEGLARVNYCTTGGDSGGPVYANNIAYGLHVASSGVCDKYYQGIIGAESGMNVRVARSG